MAGVSRAIFKQRKQCDRRATRRDHSDQDTASSRDGRARRVAYSWERRQRHDDDSRLPATGARFRNFFTSPRECHFRPPPAHKGASAESRVLRHDPPALENIIRERNGRASHRGVGAQPFAVVRTTHGNQFDRIPPGRARGATRLAESARHTNMSERKLPLFLHRTSPRFRAHRV